MTSKQELERQSAACELFSGLFCADPDFTITLSRALLAEAAVAFLPIETPQKDWFEEYCRSRDSSDRHSCSFQFEESVRVPGAESKSARLQVSRAFNGEAWSVSVRWSGAGKRSAAVQDPSKAAQILASASHKSKWCPSRSYLFDEEKGPVLFSIDEVCSVLYRQIFPANSSQKGLILITGSTNSAKSEIARGLIWKHLCRPFEGSRRRHVVSFEDPIEKRLLPEDEQFPPLGSGVPPTALRAFLDYTPRTKNVDCPTLKQATRDALRQTPDAFFVGEIREESDMKDALEFGGTGHLIVATAHAGNLVESVEKILKSVGSTQEPGLRAIYVPKILAVIHLAPCSCEVKFEGAPSPIRLTGIVPAIYHRTEPGRQNLTADGLSSIVPGFFRDDEPDPQLGSLGRQFFVHQLCGLDVNEHGFLNKSERTNDPRARIWNAVRKAQVKGPAEPGQAFQIENTLADSALMDDLNLHV